MTGKFKEKVAEAIAFLRRNAEGFELEGESHTARAFRRLADRIESASDDAGAVIRLCQGPSDGARDLRDAGLAPTWEDLDFDCD